MTTPAAPATDPTIPGIPPGAVVIPTGGPPIPAPPSTEFPGTVPPAPTGVHPVPAPPMTPPGGAPTPTIPSDLVADPRVAAALEAARREERDKMFTRLDEQGQELTRLRTFVDTAQAERTNAETIAAEAAEAERRQRLSAEELITEERARFAAERAEFQQQQAMTTALFEREAQAQRIEAFKGRRLAEESQAIAPQFLGYISGNTEEEIEASIGVAKANTQSIFQEVAAAGVAQRQTMRGVAPTGAPPAGPMDTQTGYQVLTPDEINQMDHQTYMENRGALLAAASNAAREGRLYG